MKKAVSPNEPVETAAPESPVTSEKVYVASPWRLMWWKFTQHKLAVASAVVIALLYLMAIFGDFLAPHNPNQRLGHPFATPQWPKFITEEGFHWRPVVYGMEGTLDMDTFQRVYVPDTSEAFPVQFFVRGYSYRFLGLFEMNRHLFGAPSGAGLYLMGTDQLGRDVFSRVMYGARISLSIGLIGVALSLLFGIILGGVSGYFGGTIDNIIQRMIEIIQSFPSIPLWMALASALPRDWSPITTYFGITVVLSVIGWTELARVVRGRFLSLRDEDFVTAARLSGATTPRVIRKHLLPSFLSHIIASITLAIPGMILAETALSFLGIGLRPPVISWGVLLQDAQNINAVAMAPWLMLPGLFVVITVLAFNFMGDGLRDAADPYAGAH